MDGLVDARPRLDEEVLDRVERPGDADLEPGLLGDLAEGGLLGRLAALRACPWGGSRSGRRARDDDCRRRDGAVRPRGGRRCRRRTWRSRSSGVPRRRGGAGTTTGPGARGRAQCIGPRGADGRFGRSAACRPRAAPAGRGGAPAGHDRAAQDGRAGGRTAENAPGAPRPSRRSRARLEARTNGPPAGPRTWRRCCVPSAAYGTGSVGRARAASSVSRSRRTAPVRGCHGPRPGRSRGRGRGDVQRQHVGRVRRGARRGAPRASRRRRG